MRPKAHRILWITDPWETLDPAQDTTLRLAEEAHRAGIPQSWCDVRSIRLERSRVVLEARALLGTPEGRSRHAFRFGPPRTEKPEAFTSLHYRTDPPVDLAYLHPLQLLDLGLREAPHTEVVNPISVLLSHNEKFEAAALQKKMPPSLVSSEEARLVAFGKQQRQTVLKPLHQAQSKDVHLLNWESPAKIRQAQALIRQLSHSGTTPVLLQAYLEDVLEGELRLWFVDGEILATVKKFPLPGDFKVDIDRGSRLGPAHLSRTQTQAAHTVGQYLKHHHIRLAAVDLIGAFITDFNFTSPGLICLMEKTLQTNLAKTLIERIYQLKS
jgi:glutathione synthase